MGYGRRGEEGGLAALVLHGGFGESLQPCGSKKDIYIYFKFCGNFTINV